MSVCVCVRDINDQTPSRLLFFGGWGLCGGAGVNIGTCFLTL